MTPGYIYLLNKSGQTRQRRPCQSTNTTIFQNMSSIDHRGSVCVEDGQSQCLLDTGVRQGPSSPEWVWHQTSPPRDDHCCFTPRSVGDISPQGGPGFAFGTLTLNFWHHIHLFSFSHRICVSVTPHMVTNSFQERGLPIWEIFCPPAHSGTRTPHMVMGIGVFAFP